MEISIITYGAGEVLETTFNAIASLLNSKTGSLYQPLARFSLMLGLLWSTVSMVYGNPMRLLTNWFLPFNMALMLFFVPSTKVIIHDTVTGYNYNVDNVPWGLGVTAGLISQIGDKMTKKIESTFSLPDDLKYHKTGAVMASNLIANSRTFHITNTELAETMKSFVNQCVVYDALLGQKYTMDELKKSADIWGLVSKNASPARAFTYKAPGKGSKSEIVTCKRGVTLLEPLLKVEQQNVFQFFGNQIFGKPDKNQPATHASQQLKQYLPGAMAYMTNMSKSADEYMMQQMMIHSVVDAIESQSTALGNAPNFAVRRAYLQQRANQETVAGVADQNLIAMKNVLEALIYVAFIFLLPMALMPMGWKFIAKWVGLVMWVQLWPPLYAVLNFIMNVSARAKGTGILAGSDGLTIANSVGFTNLHADMASYAGFMSLAVGSLAYALVKGGAGSFVHLSSQLAGPASSAAARASEDMLSGNYSFGNITQGTVQAHNTTFGQQNFSPAYSSGSFTQNDGVVSRVTSADGSHIVNVANSSLRSSLNMGETMTNACTEQATQAMQSAENQMIASAKSMADHNREVIDLSTQQSKAISGSESYSNGLTASQNASFSKVDALADRFAKDHGISKELSKQMLASASATVEAGVGFQVFGTGASSKVNAGVSRQFMGSQWERDVYSSAQDFAKQNNFQEALNYAAQASQDSRFVGSSDDARRYSSSISASLDKSHQMRDEASASLQKSQSYSKMASWSKQNSASINASLNQDYVNWLPQQALPNSSGPMGLSEAETILSSRPELDQLYQQRFMEDRMNNMPSYIGTNGLPASNANVTASYADTGSTLKIQAMENSLETLSTQAQQDGFGQEFNVSSHVKADTMSALLDIKDALSEHKHLMEKMGDARSEIVKLNQAKSQVRPK